ncbi:hypothetical protein [uncultured Ottowia sp.]|uniref:hypothetical protein n=1 Tax=uncultured Ottowia sp. TaxID=543067 RepID=UPI0025914A56|nr:hypothetical protein [uncultured Ottowia sp.]
MSHETPRSEESDDSGALHSALNSAFDYVIENRSDYYRKNPSNLPQLDSVSGLISSYTRNNAAISGGASLIPGPWGMAAVIPELTLVIRNQIQMVYDIGVANGKQAQLTKELLIGIFLTAMGSSAGSLLTIHGGKILVRRASLQVIQKIIAMLGGRVTQQVIKSTVSKWLPFVGAAAMATWTGYMTKNIGEKANELFKLEIEDDPQTLDIELKPE